MWKKKLGPIEQPGTLDGEVIQIGGSTAVPYRDRRVGNRRARYNPARQSVHGVRYPQKYVALGTSARATKRTGKLKRDLPHAFSLPLSDLEAQLGAELEGTPAAGAIHSTAAADGSGNVAESGVAEGVARVC